MKQLKNYSKAEDKKLIDDTLEKCDIDKDSLDKYSGMGEDALINELINSVKTAKANGTYNSEQMLSFINIMSPHLDERQKEKLANVLNIIEDSND